MQGAGLRQPGPFSSPSLMHGGTTMNADILKGKWKQMRGKAREWWGDLTDDELDTVNGRVDTLVGLLQERYGYAKDAAEKEVERRAKEFDESEKLAHQNRG